MRFTNKAAEASLITPKGLSPALIGKVVSVQTMTKKDTYLQPETMIKFVGILKTYTLLTNGVKFTLDGGTEKFVGYTNEAVEFFYIQEVRDGYNS